MESRKPFPNTFEEILETFQNNPEYHLTGSRFFGGFKDTSDYDFFTQDSSETEEFLIDLNFKRLLFTPYMDNQMCKVYRRRWDDMQIDIQLVSSSKERQFVQMLIGNYLNCLDHTPSKFEMVSLWDSMIKCLYIRDFLAIED